MVRDVQPYRFWRHAIFSASDTCVCTSLTMAMRVVLGDCDTDTRWSGIAAQPKFGFPVPAKRLTWAV